jgi:hypothetical protein
MYDFKGIAESQIIDNIPAQKMRVAKIITAAVIFQFFIMIIIFFVVLKEQPPAAEDGTGFLDAFFIAVLIFTFITFAYPYLLNLFINSQLANVRRGLEELGGESVLTDGIGLLFRNYFTWNLIRLMILEAGALLGTIFLFFANSFNQLESNMTYWIAVVPIIHFFARTAMMFPNEEKAALFIKEKLLDRL